MTTNRTRLYRYRPLNILSDKSVVDELRNREIFLGTLEDNNDPMDGIQDVYWDGDEVLWKNFIRHYCFCLVNAVAFVSIGGDTATFDVSIITARATPHSLPQAPIRQLLEDFHSAVADSEHIKELTRALVRKQRLHQGDLELLLGHYHRHFLALLRPILTKNHRHDSLPGLELMLQAEEKQSLGALLDSVESSHLRVLAEVSANTHAQMQLITYYDYRIKSPHQSVGKENYVKLISAYPGFYLEACVRAVYGDYYLACFSERNDSESMWGHYAAGHKGICLIFEFEERDGHNLLNLVGGKQLALYKVAYRDEPPAINVFEGLGYLPRLELDQHWLTYNGDSSAKAATYREPGYHQRYWDSYSKKVSHKFPSWQYEQEHRAVKSSWFEGPLPKEQRLVHYDDSHLQGVIFGMRTPTETRVQIMKALDETLSEERKKDFKFYRAHYFPRTSKLQVHAMDLLKFEIET